MKDSDARMLVAEMAAAYKYDLAEPQMRTYIVDLRDLDVERTAEVLLALRRTSEWFPKAAQIRRAYALSIIGAPQVNEAYAQALGPKEERHPMVREARRMCGDQADWRETPDGIMRRRFADTYNEKVTKAVLAIAAPGAESIGLPEGTPPIAGEIEP